MKVYSVSTNNAGYHEVVGDDFAIECDHLLSIYIHTECVAMFRDWECVVSKEIPEEPHYGDSPTTVEVDSALKIRSRQ